jgi:uncharacterized membrane protein HdeD (DUF308 family)
MESTTVFYTTLILFCIVLSLYRVLFGLSTGHQEGVLLMVFIGVVAVMFALQFYIICSNADCIMNIVSY